MAPFQASLAREQGDDRGTNGTVSLFQRQHFPGSRGRRDSRALIGNLMVVSARDAAPAFRDASRVVSHGDGSLMGAFVKSAGTSARPSRLLLQTSIGHFIYWFSQLEFTIKSRLADALNLPEDLFDIIIGPYDFAMLCTVTERTLMRDASKSDQTKIKKYFNDCRKLNQEARVVVAHGSWTFEGARHVSRNTLTAKHHFAKAADLDKQAKETKRLMAVLYVGAL
jgi:hypothetical protein